MNYLKCGYVDIVTGVLVTAETPALNAPDLPKVDGIVFGFALESEYPTLTPTLYCTAPDGADTAVNGVLAVLSQTDYEAIQTVELAARTSQAMSELFERIATRRYIAETAGIIWNGFFIDTDRDSQPKIQSARTAAKDGLRKDDAVWKCGDPKTGQPVYRVTTNAEMIDIGNQAYDYIQACYDREGALMAAVAGGTYTVDMLNEGWPEDGQQLM